VILLTGVETRTISLRHFLLSSQGPRILSADKPLNNPATDELEHAAFAQMLAESIIKMTPPEGLVMAMYEPWGSGKSTVVNFITHYVNRSQRPERPIIVRFNP